MVHLDIKPSNIVRFPKGALSEYHAVSAADRKSVDAKYMGFYLAVGPASGAKWQWKLVDLDALLHQHHELICQRL